MAIDVYLHIEGIKGESTDDRHNGWIECQSVNWAMSQPEECDIVHSRRALGRAL
ncbi:hypothetical protein GCM10008020_33400 [Massilia psychrophila]|nr:hypothetical protein GCM10008020_33400 [Massilia psychrophila]